MRIGPRTAWIAATAALALVAGAATYRDALPRTPPLAVSESFRTPTAVGLMRRRVVPRASELPPWSWPVPEAFLIASDAVRKARPHVLLSGTARGAGYPELGAVRVVATLNEWESMDVREGRIDIVAAEWKGDERRTEVGLRLIGSYAIVSAAEADARAIREAVFEPWPWSRRPTISVSDFVPLPSQPPTEDAALFAGYAAALLGDSPGDPEIPAGQCSLDSGPASRAEEIATVAEAEGALGRFLRMRLRVAGDRFDRAAFSSFADELHGVEASGFASAPVDLTAFLAGLCFSFDDPVARESAISPQRLGRLIVVAGLADALAPWLRAQAEDSRLDPFNRLRMLQTLQSVVARYDARPRVGVAAWIDADRYRIGLLRRLDLRPEGRWWLDGSLSP